MSLVAVLVYFFSGSAHAGCIGGSVELEEYVQGQILSSCPIDGEMLYRQYSPDSTRLAGGQVWHRHECGGYVHGSTCLKHVFWMSDSASSGGQQGPATVKPYYDPAPVAVGGGAAPAQVPMPDPEWVEIMARYGPSDAPRDAVYSVRTIEHGGRDLSLLGPISRDGSGFLDVRGNPLTERQVTKIAAVSPAGRAAIQRRSVYRVLTYGGLAIGTPLLIAGALKFQDPSVDGSENPAIYAGGTILLLDLLYWYVKSANPPGQRVLYEANVNMSD